MATKKKMLEAAAGSAGGGAGLNVEEVFSTYLYTGNSSTQTITNGIDLDGEGGLVWIKNRDTAYDHWLFDTDRGVNKYLETSDTSAESPRNNALTAFNSNGFTVGTDAPLNLNGDGIASWTFRKAPKFFDVVTYTGDGTNPRTISHNLGTTVGHITVKPTSSSGSWWNFHRTLGAGKALSLNSTDAALNSNNFWGGVEPTSTEFTVQFNNNAAGVEYVAYLFAHNDGDGEFGPTGDQDIIKCGSFTSDGSSDYDIDLGFEPQLLILKRATGGTGNWFIQDNIREFSTDRSDILFPNLNNAEGNYVANYIPLSTGFGVRNGVPSGDHIYIAIRRGPMGIPESASEVFDISDGTTPSSPPNYTSGFPVDFAVEFNRTSTDDKYVGDRLRQGKSLRTSSTTAETNASSFKFDYMTGWNSGTYANTNIRSWMWRRAPSFFDVVAYTGNGVAGRTVSHNLGVAPEMMWVKVRTGYTANWIVYHSGLNVNGDNAPETDFIRLDDDRGAFDDGGAFWNSTAPTDSNFTVGSSVGVNGSSGTYIAYLFASLDGVSKVGSYTGDGTNDGSKVIDCGFSSGARFVLIKRTDSTSDWFVFDTERGIVANSDDPALRINTTNAEDLANYIEPNSSGFALKAPLNQSSGTYIFYAIA
jgi:hypothetical protein